MSTEKEAMAWRDISVKEANATSLKLLNETIEALRTVEEKQNRFWFPDGINRIRVVVGPVEVEVTGSK